MNSHKYESVRELLQSRRKGSLIIIGTYPDCDKTAIVVDIAINTAVEQKIPVAVFSLDMSKEQLAVRYLHNQLNVDHRVLALAKMSIFTCDTRDCSISDFCDTAKILVTNEGVQLIIINYLQLMSGWPEDHGTRIPEVNHIVQTLKETAVSLDVNIIVMSQLTRYKHTDTDVRVKPTIKDIRSTNAIEEYVDLVLIEDSPTGVS